MEGKLEAGTIIVVDIGKTQSKLSLWTRAGQMLDKQVRRNSTVLVDGIRRLDSDGIGAWLIDTMKRYADENVSCILPVAHGAGVVMLVDDALAVPPLDYEQPLPSDIVADYRRQRDPFTLTGSPALPDGLNIGAQLFWLDRLSPGMMSRATLLPWAQYWAWLLSGSAFSEVTSLGCHSDLWVPSEMRFSPLAHARGWAARFAPFAKAGQPIGTLRPDLARTTGLSADTLVLAGLHDSNAALLAARGFAEIADREATVLSTGTWFIGMRTPDSTTETASLPEERDCLVNVDVTGQPIPSARFMGGREIEMLIGLDTRQVDIKPDQPALLAAVAGLVAHDQMLLPTFAPGCGPFPHGEGHWINAPDDWFARRAAACLYAALVADEALELIGSRERLLIEGRFAEAQVFVRALAALRPDLQVFSASAHSDVSFGALCLINPDLRPQGQLMRAAPLETDLTAYRLRWHHALGATA